MTTNLEIREATEDNEGVRTLHGAIKYEKDSHEMRDWMGDTIIEQIASGTFADSLKTRDVVGLWSHDTGSVLGTTKSSTLRLYDGADELRFELDIPDTSVGNDAWTLIKRGDISGVSFGMRVTKDKWSTEKRDDEEIIYRRTVLNAELYEISPLAFPAYPENEVSARSLQDFKDRVNKQDKEKRDLELIELELETY